MQKWRQDNEFHGMWALTTSSCLFEVTDPMCSIWLSWHGLLRLCFNPNWQPAQSFEISQISTRDKTACRNDNGKQHKGWTCSHIKSQQFWTSKYWRPNPVGMKSMSEELDSLVRYTSSKPSEAFLLIVFRSFSGKFLTASCKEAFWLSVSAWVSDLPVEGETSLEFTLVWRSSPLRNKACLWSSPSAVYSFLGFSSHKTSSTSSRVFCRDLSELSFSDSWSFISLRGQYGVGVLWSRFFLSSEGTSLVKFTDRDRPLARTSAWLGTG